MAWLIKIPILPENFNGLKDVEVYISGKFYKYTYGLTPNLTAINEKLEEVIKAGYESAFVISFKDGKRLDWIKQ